MPLKGFTLDPGLDGFLAYAQRFDIIPNQGLNGGIDSVAGMYGLRRSMRTNELRQGGIIQLKHIRKVLMLVPCFQRDVDTQLTKENCTEAYSDFWLNNYFDKETFYSFRLTETI